MTRRRFHYRRSVTEAESPDSGSYDPGVEIRRSKDVGLGKRDKGVVIATVGERNQ